MSLKDIRHREKRDFIRMTLETEVQCKIIETGENLNGTCKNLSHTGIQFVTSKHINKGTEMQIKLSIDSANVKPLQARLLVNRVESLDNEKYLISGKLTNVR